MFMHKQKRVEQVSPKKKRGIAKAGFFFIRYLRVTGAVRKVSWRHNSEKSAAENQETDNRHKTV